MKTFPLVLTCIALAFSSGCASSSSGLSPEAKKLQNERYEYIKTVDSHIPQRVLKGQKAEHNSGTSPVAVLEGEKARDILRPRGGGRF